MKKDFPSHYTEMKEQFPEYFDAVEQMGNALREAGPIKEKCAHLIQLAASVAIRSEGGVHSHTRRAIEAGASAEEIRHSLILLTSTLGFPTVMAGMSWVNDILEE